MSCAKRNNPRRQWLLASLALVLVAAWLAALLGCVAAGSGHDGQRLCPQPWLPPFGPQVAGLRRLAWGPLPRAGLRVAGHPLRLFPPPR
ncbi:MAG: hypothetical protein KatS3mg131_1396 [Candidatus Tectimicrobiota bacterium]|nr:MAG: hypothetical protein KatS3mg131_1396 [Candidatus Tectomicrobia bacterium]